MSDLDPSNDDDFGTNAESVYEYIFGIFVAIGATAVFIAALVISI